MTADIIRERKDDIVNLFQGSTPPVVVEEIVEAPSTESSTDLEGSVSNDPPKAAKAGKKRRNLSLKINWAPLNDLTGPLLISAAISGDVNAVRLWLAVVGDIEYKDKDHFTALIWAASAGHPEVVGLLLEKGANIVTGASDGATALYIAAWNGHLEVVKLLLEKGASIEAAKSTGATALLIAAQGGRLKVVELLLEEGANIEAALNNETTALYIAA